MAQPISGDDEAALLAPTLPRPSAASDVASDVALAVGSSVGRYVILRRLGEGGMGVVYAAYDAELDRKVALKLLRQTGASAEQRARLLREAQAMARVAHPNVVAVYEVGEVGGRVYIAMEYIDGTTLSVWQTQDRSWSEILEMYRQAGAGLLAAHQAGLVHRERNREDPRRKN